MDINWNIIAIIISLLGFAAAAYLYSWVKKQPGGDKQIEDIGLLIRQGSYAFLKREYNVLGKFVLVTAIIILAFLPEPIWSNGEPLRNVLTAIAYILGSILSGIAGVIGMSIATVANVKTAVAAKKGIAPAFSVGFRGYGNGSCWYKLIWCQLDLSPYEGFYCSSWF